MDFSGYVSSDYIFVLNPEMSGCLWHFPCSHRATKLKLIEALEMVDSYIVRQPYAGRHKQYKIRTNHGQKKVV